MLSPAPLDPKESSSSSNADVLVTGHCSGLPRKRDAPLECSLCDRVPEHLRQVVLLSKLQLGSCDPDAAPAAEFWVSQALRQSQDPVLRLLLRGGDKVVAALRSEEREAQPGLHRVLQTGARGGGPLATTGPAIAQQDDIVQRQAGLHQVLHAPAHLGEHADTRPCCGPQQRPALGTAEPHRPWFQSEGVHFAFLLLLAQRRQRRPAVLLGDLQRAISAALDSATHLQQPHAAEAQREGDVVLVGRGPTPCQLRLRGLIDEQGAPHPGQLMRPHAIVAYWAPAADEVWVVEPRGALLVVLPHSPLLLFLSAPLGQVQSGLYVSHENGAPVLGVQMHAHHLSSFVVPVHPQTPEYVVPALHRHQLRAAAEHSQLMVLPPDH
mmetsp:Transcript_64304/g.188162  ORF Transcript_64304/g.188162 Transcript_64304/m.188162 type:complete len:380 (+) Transcript_64304:118-1257(+)